MAMTAATSMILRRDDCPGSLGLEQRSGDAALDQDQTMLYQTWQTVFLPEPYNRLQNVRT